MEAFVGMRDEGLTDADINLDEIMDGLYLGVDR